MAGKVFVSHAQEDDRLCAPLLRALDAWGVDYWYDRHEQGVGAPLSEQAQLGLAECSIFLRICTRNTQRSYWMSIESGAFLGLQADDHRAGKAGLRTLVNVVLDPAYVREPFDRTTVVIDASDSSQPGWVNDLRAALGLPPLEGMDAIVTVAREVSPTPPSITRRRAIGLGVAGAAVLAAAGAGGAVLLSRGGLSHPSARATPTAIPPTDDSHLLWFFDARDPNNATPVRIAGGPATDGSTIYVAPSDGSVYALDLAGRGKSIKPIWKHPGSPGGATLRGPAVEAGFVYACAAGEGVYALAAASGTRQWQYKTGSAETSVVVAAGDLLYVTEPSEGNFVGVLDAHTGAFRHFIGPDSTLSISASIPVVLDDMLYAGDAGGYAYAFDATKDAPPLWRADVGSAGAKNGNSVFSTVAVADGTSYFNSSDGAIYAFDAQTGTRRWRQLVTSFYISTPVVSDGLVIIGATDNHVCALDVTTGAVRWRSATKGGVRSSPVVVDGMVYVGSDDKNVYAIEAKSGKLAQTYKTGGEIVSKPLVLNGAVYVTGLDGFVYAFKL